MPKESASLGRPRGLQGVAAMMETRYGDDAGGGMQHMDGR